MSSVLAHKMATERAGAAENAAPEDGRAARDAGSRTPEARGALRRALLEELSPWYRGWVHLAAPTLVGGFTVAAAIWVIEDLAVWELLAIPALFLVANAAEWRIHRDLLHKRSPIAPVLYEQHTPQHHRLYVTEDMRMRSWREFKFVLIPPYGILLILLATLPITALLWVFISHNVAALFWTSCACYMVGYEWLHLSYHLPDDHWAARLRIIRLLSRHHAIHHNPTLMQKWNMNVSVPFWDWVRGTMAPREKIRIDPWTHGRE